MAIKRHRGVDELNLSVRKKANYQHYLKIEQEARSRRETLEREGASSTPDLIDMKLKEIGKVLRSLKKVPALQRELMKKAYQIYIPKSSRGRKPLETAA